MSSNDIRGVGGWLILVFAGLIITPLQVLAFLAQEMLPVFTEGHWALLTDSLSASYHPLWAPLIIFEIAGNLVLVAACICALFFLFSHSPRFPKWMIAIYIGGFAFVLVDMLLVKLIPASAVDNDPESFAQIFRAALACGIWVPYMLRSKRVRNTFSRRDPNLPTVLEPREPSA